MSYIRFDLEKGLKIAELHVIFFIYFGFISLVVIMDSEMKLHKVSDFFWKCLNPILTIFLVVTPDFFHQTSVTC